ncbi:MAG TPA: hypothetical protein PLN86_16370 [Candidatus Hydrogenedentes bacterium]|nr:hypothetical protein [Candidatus Hydrogenedentota bacterium]
MKRNRGIINAILIIAGIAAFAAGMFYRNMTAVWAGLSIALGTLAKEVV